jgi:hypothetical protein
MARAGNSVDEISLQSTSRVTVVVRAHELPVNTIQNHSLNGGDDPFIKLFQTLSVLPNYERVILPPRSPRPSPCQAGYGSRED